MKLTCHSHVFWAVGLFFIISGLSVWLRGYERDIMPDGTIIHYPKVNWQKEFGGRWYAVQQYPKGAQLPGLGSASMSLTSIRKFCHVRFEGNVRQLEHRHNGATSVVTSIQIANHPVHLPLRLEWISILVGFLVFGLDGLLWLQIKRKLRKYRT